MKVGYVVLYVNDADARRGVEATSVGDHEGTPRSTFSGPERRWFRVTQ